MPRRFILPGLFPGPPAIPIACSGDGARIAPPVSELIVGIHQFFRRHDTILRSIRRTEHMGSQRVGDTTVGKLAPDDRVRGSERQFAGPNGIASSASDNVCLAGTDNQSRAGVEHGVVEITNIRYRPDGLGQRHPRKGRPL